MPPRANRQKRKEKISFQLVLDENGDTVLRPLTFPKHVRSKKDLAKLLPEDFPLDIIENDNGAGVTSYDAQATYTREGANDGQLSAEDRRLLEKFKHMSLDELGFGEKSGDWFGEKEEEYDPTVFDEVDDDDMDVIDMQEDVAAEKTDKRNQRLNAAIHSGPGADDEEYDPAKDLTRVYAYDYNKHFKPMSGLGTFITPSDGVMSMDPNKMEPIVPAIPENDVVYQEDLAKDETVKTRSNFISQKVKGHVVSAASGLELPVFEGNFKYNHFTEDFLEPLESGETELYEEIEDNIFELLLQSSDDDEEGPPAEGLSRADLMRKLESGSLFDKDEKKTTTTKTTTTTTPPTKKGAALGAWSDEDEEENTDNRRGDDQDFGFDDGDDLFGYGDDDDGRNYNYDDYDDDKCDDDDIMEEVEIILDENDLQDAEDALLSKQYFERIKNQQKDSQGVAKQVKKTGHFDEDGNFVDPDDVPELSGDLSKMDSEMLRFHHMLNVYEDESDDDYDDKPAKRAPKQVKKAKRNVGNEEEDEDDEDDNRRVRFAVQQEELGLDDDDEEEDDYGYYDEDEDDYYDDDGDGPMFTINKAGVDLTDGDVRSTIHEFVHGKAKRIKETADPTLIPQDVLDVTKRLIFEQQCEPQPSMKQVAKEIDRSFAKKKKDSSDIRSVKTTMSTTSNVPTTIKETRIKTVKVSKTNQKEILKNSVKNPYAKQFEKQQPVSIFDKEQVNTIKLGSESLIPLGVLAKHRQERETRKEYNEDRELNNNVEYMTKKNTMSNQTTTTPHEHRQAILKKANKKCCDHDHHHDHSDEEEFTSAANAKKGLRFNDDNLEQSTSLKDIDQIATPAAATPAPTKGKLLFSLPTETVTFDVIKTHDDGYKSDSEDEDNKKKHVNKYAHLSKKSQGGVDNDDAEEDEDDEQEGALYKNMDLSKYDDDEEEGEEDEDDEFDPNALYIPGLARRRGETKEERKARKLAVKEERKEKRQIKKDTRELYKQAGKHQKQQEMVNKFYNPAHKRIL